MYTDADFYAIDAQVKKRWGILSIPCVLLLAILVASLVLRIQWLTILCTLLCGGALIFFYDLFLKPLCCYRCLMRNILTGIRRETDAIFSSFSTEVAQVEGVDYYTMNVVCQDDEGEDYDRFFYFDIQKPFPPLKAGEPIRVIYHDRMVCDIVSKDEL